MGVVEVTRELLAARYELIFPHLDERQRRLVAGSDALVAGHGGIRLVASAAGMAEATVSRGVAELDGGAEPLGRARRPGGGRKRAEDADPGLVPALLSLVEDSVRGDPCSPLTWTTRSLRKLAGELAAAGHPCSADTAGRLLRGQGFSLQANAKTIEGSQHPDRDAQFRYISGQVKEHLAAGQPVISVDAKKKEQVGNYARAGREWRPKGDPVNVRDHSFGEEDGLGQVIPYGVYDLAANTGFVNVGTDHNTAAFAVESVRRWWQQAGQQAYPGAARLLITADAGGANGYRTRAWKTGLAQLAAETGLQITCCHFPPGTSKWNKIEHRLFSHITMNWRGRPLTSHQVIINTIAAVTTRAGLAVTAALDTSRYPNGTKITSAQMAGLEQVLTRHAFHGTWNYTLRPVPSPAPAASLGCPRPAPPARWDQHALAALTGIPPGDLDEVITATDLPLAARREQRLHTRRRGPRRRHSWAGRVLPARKLDHTDHVLATTLKLRYGLPASAMGPLFGADPTTISTAIKATREILAQQHITIPASPVRCHTLASLCHHAAASGIQLPPLPAPPPGQHARTTPTTSAT